MVQMQMEPNDYNSQLDQGACDMLAYPISMQNRGSQTVVLNAKTLNLS